MNKVNTELKQVILIGGKQHVVVAGSRITVNQDSTPEGDIIKSTDLLSGKEVSLKVIRSFLADKIKGVKFRSKSRYTRRYGHRQPVMTLEVMTAAESKAPAKASAKDKVSSEASSSAGTKTVKKVAAKKAAPKSASKSNKGDK